MRGGEVIATCAAAIDHTPLLVADKTAALDRSGLSSPGSRAGPIRGQFLRPMPGPSRAQRLQMAHKMFAEHLGIRAGMRVQ
jgi:hypothetical protein